MTSPVILDSGAWRRVKVANAITAIILDDVLSAIHARHLKNLDASSVDMRIGLGVSLWRHRRSRYAAAS